MKLADFTFDLYGQLLESALESGWTITTLRDYLTNKPEKPVLIIRHDVDRRVRNAPRMAKLEADYGVSSTYYFRTKTFDRKIVENIEDMGHEIGYHYEDLAKCNGNLEKAHNRFRDNLITFREVAEIDTAAAHGSALSQYSNLDIWTDEYTLEAYDLIGEAYLSMGIDKTPSEIDYVSETHRTWRTPPHGLNVESTPQLIDAIQSGETDELYLLAHPNRWAINTLQPIERGGWDVCAETIKTVVDRLHSNSSEDPVR
jgi:hypothetical protein